MSVMIDEMIWVWENLKQKLLIGKPILRENERARIMGFEQVTEKCRKWMVLIKKWVTDSNPNERDSNH